MLPAHDRAAETVDLGRARVVLEIDAEAGNLQRSFEVENGDTRFLGDLYQELSERAKKKYALLRFV